MKRIILTLLILTLIISTVGVALAYHTEYIAQDENNQLEDIAGPENFNFDWWALSNTSLWWYAEDALRDDVIAVKDNWGAAIPQLSWWEMSAAGSANVRFGVEHCLLNAPACVRFTIWENPSDYMANYWLKASIWLDPDYDWTSEESTRSALAHEIGHLYGLDERYIEPGSCNPDEIAVMDTVDIIGNQVVHCDSDPPDYFVDGPEDVDVTRVTSPIGVKAS